MSYYQKSDMTFFARQRADGTTGFWWLTIDTAMWAEAKNDLKRTFDHATGLRYDPGEREWTLPSYSLTRLQRWADSWAGRQEWDALPRNGEHRHYQSERAQDAPGAAVTDAYRALYLVPDAPLWAAEAVYRAGCKMVHPDMTDGDHAQAVALNTAIEHIRMESKMRGRAS